MRTLLKLRRTFHRLGDTSGLALTEFALSLPIMLTLGVGGVELASYVNANMRTSQIALSVSDNAGRIRETIDETDIDAAMIGARVAGESIKFGANGRVILSMIETNGQSGTNAGQKITWQRCYGAKVVNSSYGVAGDGATNASRADGFGPAGNKIVAAGNAGVMFVEVFYDYQPIFLVDNKMRGGLGGKTLHYTAAFPVRERTDNAMKNGFNLNDDKKWLCSKYSAT